MFQGCTSLKIVPFFDTSKVESMSFLFYDCYSLQTIPAFNTSKVTGMTRMFWNCNSLTSVPELDTRKATSMNNLFCFNIISYISFFIYTTCIKTTTISIDTSSGNESK